METAIRRLSCLPGAITQAIKDESLQVPGQNRRPSLQEIEDSALLFLERRKSSDSGIGNIQPDLYRKRGSIIKYASRVKEGSFAASVQLHLDYDFQKSDFLVNFVDVSLNIQLNECEFWFFVDGDSKHQLCKVVSGKILQKDILKFPISYDQLLDRQLTMELVTFENEGSTIIKHGRCQMDLNVLNPADDLVIWIDLESIHDVENRGGKLNVCLQYLSSAQRLTLSVHQANALTISGTVPSTFVKATLSIEGKILKKRKTAIKKSATCPVWNEVLTFEIEPKIVNKCRLELSVVDVGTNKIIGILVLGENTGHGSRIWREALKGQSQKPRWLPLVPPPVSH